MNNQNNKLMFSTYAEEKEEFVLGFLSEKHLNHYLNLVLYDTPESSFLFTQGSCSKLGNSIKQKIKTSTLNLGFSELFFKEFRVKQKGVPEQVLKNEVITWKEWIEQNSNFHVVFAVLSVGDANTETQIRFVLREDREREDMLLY